MKRERQPARPETYVKVAQRLLRTRPEVSAQQVAWHTHRRFAHVNMFDLDCDVALSKSGKFTRANFINSNCFGVTLWKLAGNGEVR